MRRIGTVTIILIFISLLVGQVAKFNFGDVGIADITNQKKVIAMDCRIECLIEEDYYNAIYSSKTKYYEELDASSHIAIVMPTGNVIQNHDFFGQEVKIKKMIKGNHSLVDKTTYLYDVNGFNIIEGNPTYYGLYSLMKIGEKYLVFFDDIEYDLMFQNKGYGLVGDVMGYIRISSSTSTPIKSPVRNVRLNDIIDMDYFTHDKKTIALLNEMKEYLLNKYLNK